MLEKNDFCWKCEDFGVCMMCMKVRKFGLEILRKKKNRKKKGEGSNRATRWPAKGHNRAGACGHRLACGHAWQVRLARRRAPGTPGDPTDQFCLKFLEN